VAKKLDLRPQYIKEINNYTFYLGYKVTQSGVVFNKYDKQVKPKFKFRGKKIDYVYIDIWQGGIKRRISYHRFIYMAWNPEFAETNDRNLVVTTHKSRFDYRLANLKVITREEHIKALALINASWKKDERLEIVKTYNEIKDVMTQEQFAHRLKISTKTLYRYIKEVEDEL
jgi:hypothetical protein